MTDDEKLKQQMTFFDYIYPSMSRRLDELETDNRLLNDRQCRLSAELEIAKDHFFQYKKKIQRIEQFLIEKGLIKLLKD